MADKKLNAFTAAAAFTATCSLVGSDSASPTGSFLFTKAVMDAAYANLNSAFSVVVSPTTGSAFGSAGEWIIRNNVSPFAGLATFSGGIGAKNLALISNGICPMALFTEGNQILIKSDQILGFSPNPNSANSISGFAHDSAGVIRVNTGLSDTGGGIRYPETAADADLAAPTNGATIYSKKVAGKNALFVRFPTGVVQQLAIEL